MIRCAVLVGVSVVFFLGFADSVFGDGCWKYGTDYGPKADPFEDVEPLNDPNAASVEESGDNGEWLQKWECTIGAGETGRCNIEAKARAEHKTDGDPMAAETHTATASVNQDGFRLIAFVGWQESGERAHMHGAPSNARTSGSASGQVFAKIVGNAENGSDSTTNLGIAVADAFAEVTFSGVEAGHARVDLHGSLAEGGTLGGASSYSVKKSGEPVDSKPVTITPIGNIFISPTLTKTCQMTYATPLPGANIGADQWQAHSTVTMSANCRNRAAQALAEGKASVQAFSLTLPDGGTHSSCKDGDDHGGHSAKKVDYPPAPAE